MKNTITTTLVIILTSIFLTLTSLSSAFAWGTTSYTQIGSDVWTNNFNSGQQCVYSKVGNLTYRNCY